MGDFYRVPADNRGLNYDKYFRDGDEDRNTLTEFNSNNTRRLNLEETKELLSKAEWALSSSSKFDIIVTYFIRNQIYDIYKVNLALFDHHQNTLGA